MTVEEAVVYALARTSEFSASVPSTRSLMYRRVGVRQQQLFARAARLNPEYFGICATGVLDTLQADLADLVDPIEAADTVTMLTIADPGTSGWSADREIRVVALADADAELPPRATIRNRVIRSVGTDLTGVVSLTIHYSRVPQSIGPLDGARLLDLPAPHDELVVIDLTKSLVAKTVSLAPAERAAALDVLATEEVPLLAAFDTHVRHYAGSLTTRFGSTPFAPASGFAPTEGRAP